MSKKHLVAGLAEVQRDDDAFFDRSANGFGRGELAEVAPKQVFRSHRNVQERNLERHMISHNRGRPIATDRQNRPQFARLLAGSGQSVQERRDPLS